MKSRCIHEKVVCIGSIGYLADDDQLTEFLQTPYSPQSGFNRFAIFINDLDCRDAGADDIRIGTADIPWSRTLISGLEVAGVESSRISCPPVELL